MWGIASVLWGYLQYCGGCSVQQGDNISTVEDSFSTVEGISALGDTFSTCRGQYQYSGCNMSTVEDIQYSGGYLQYSGGLASFSTVGGDNISTVEVMQYSEDKDLTY